MNKSNLEWLKEQLPLLLDKKILDPPTAKRLLDYYTLEEEEKDVKFNRAVTFIGVVFVGLGLLLVLAYNWETLTRPARLSIAVGLLFISQIVMFLGIVYNRLTVTHKESLAAFQSLMIGASISLVGQTYELTLHLDAILLIWMFLILPLSYLTKTICPAILYSILSIIWMIDNFSTPQAISIWIFIVLLIPIYRHFDQSRTISSVPLAWLIVVNALAAFILTFEKYFDDLILQCLSLFFSFLFVVGSHLEVRTPVSQRPLTAIGVSGIVITFFALSFPFCWEHVPHNLAVPAWTLMFLLTFLSLAFSYKLCQMSSSVLTKLLLAAPVLLLGVSLFHVFTDQQIYVITFISLYLLTIGMMLIEKGFKDTHPGLLNCGMLILSLLATAKFFDSSISFWNRGIAFIFIGILFIFVNFKLIRNKKKKLRQKIHKV